MAVRSHIRTVEPRVRREFGEFRLYRAWGDMPREAGLWRRFLAWLLGGWQQLLYVGITSRATVDRWAEHCAEKRWAPDVACWERDRRVYDTLAEVEAAEKSAIERERPLWNVAHNGNNPRAVTLTRRRLPRHVAAARARFAVLAVAWLALAGALWWVLSATMAAPNAAAAGVVGASAIVGRAAWPRKRRRRRR